MHAYMCAFMYIRPCCKFKCFACIVINVATIFVMIIYMTCCCKGTVAKHPKLIACYVCNVTFYNNSQAFKFVWYGVRSATNLVTIAMNCLRSATIQPIDVPHPLPSQVCMYFVFARIHNSHINRCWLYFGRACSLWCPVIDCRRHQLHVQRITCGQSCL